MLFYYYIYKSFKLSVTISLLLLIYIVVYIDWYIAHANNIFISNSYVIDSQIKYTKAMYGLTDNKKNKDYTNEKINIINIDDKYNTTKHSFNIYIENLGINEPLFTFPMTYNVDDYNLANQEKIDHDMIDFELIDVNNILKWFMIWWHSSGVRYNESKYKNVFSSLDELEIWNIIKLVREDWLVINYRIKNMSIKNLDEKIILSNKFYVYTCYPVGTNKQRLLLELEKI